MKLVYCPVCGDVVRLIEYEWRMCDCQNSGGQYNADRMTATVGGQGLVFGIGNYFFNDMFQWFTRAQRRRYRTEYTGQPDSDCWWSKHPAGRDTQIFVIDKPTGPRIRMKVTTKPGAKRSRITVTDRRRYTVAGKQRLTLEVPANPKPSFKGRR